MSDDSNYCRSRDQEDLSDLSDIEDVAVEEEAVLDESMQQSRAPVIQEQSLPNLRNPAPTDGKVPSINNDI